MSILVQTVLNKIKLLNKLPLESLDFKSQPYHVSFVVCFYEVDYYTSLKQLHAYTTCYYGHYTALNVSNHYK